MTIDAAAFRDVFLVAKLLTRASNYRAQSLRSKRRDMNHYALSAYSPATLDHKYVDAEMK
jgi:hypothetical protein